MEKIIEINDLTKFYRGGITGIETLTLTVNEGEIYGFLGSNGSGKTTTIRLLLNFLFPTSGSARIFGKDIIADHIEITRNIGYIPSPVSPNRSLTGEAFLKYTSGFYKRVSGRARSELLERFEFSSRDLKRKIKDYSSGMARKIAIIQAFEHRPRLIIMDEPTEGLDPVMQHEFYKLMKEYKSKGGTAFISSHHLREVERVCDRAAIIRKGRLVTVEDVQDLMNGMSRKIKVVFGKKVTKFDLIDPAWEIITFDGKKLEAIIISDLNRIIKILSKFEITDMTLPPRSLEDVFLDYYQEGE